MYIYKYDGDMSVLLTANEGKIEDLTFHVSELMQ